MNFDVLCVRAGVNEGDGTLRLSEPDERPVLSWDNVVDATPRWAALCRSLTLVDAVDYGHRRSSTLRASTRCDDLTIGSK